MTALARVACAAVLVAVSFGWPARALAHDFHASFAIIERSADASILEISVRVFADDLEDALSAREGRPVKFDVTTDIDRLISDYMTTTLELRTQDGRAKPCTWVGKEARIDSVWIYLETPAEDLARLQVRSRVLHERFADQVNLVQVKDGRRQTMLNFRRGDDFKSIGN